jgi:hypothetical protein
MSQIQVSDEKLIELRQWALQMASMHYQNIAESTSAVTTYAQTIVDFVLQTGNRLDMTPVIEGSFMVEPETTPVI